MKRDVLLNLVLTNQSVVWDVKAGGGLLCSDHELVVLRIMQGISKVAIRFATQDFKSQLQLLRSLLGRIPWVRTLEGRRTEER